MACQERDLNSDRDFTDSDEMVYYHSTTLHSVYALTKKRVSPINRVQWGVARQNGTAKHLAIDLCAAHERPTNDGGRHLLFRATTS